MQAISSWRRLSMGLAIGLLITSGGGAWGQDQPAPTKQPSRNKSAVKNPFARRIDVPEFPDDAEWLNVGRPLKMADLRGKFVLLDFWTYCCINCIHILPELKKLEQAYPQELVVIGVHSAKFETEKGTKNIEEAILRYEIAHPVINDSQHFIWQTYGVRSWPTVLLIDPEGKAVWGSSGEIEFETVDGLLKAALPYYREQKLVNQTPLKIELLAHQAKPTPLRYPGKLLADEASDRLYISDSNHNRIVVATLDGRLVDVIGSGQIGEQDGAYELASFDHPQGMALVGQTLYVADTENHLLRKIDLQARTVRTIAGTGRQRRGSWPGVPDDADSLADLPARFVGKPLVTALNSPWDVLVHDKLLFIAMAGPHQIWKMPLDESEIGPYAGNSREDIVDGILLPRQPFEQKQISPLTGAVVDPPAYSSFAQPSGLASNGTVLFVADSEGSSIRVVPYKGKGVVQTLVGTAHLPDARLFTFGDQDGPPGTALLQHPIGVAYHDGVVYVADTYNHKLRKVDAATGQVTTLAGDGKPGDENEPPRFREPCGLSVARGKLYVADTNNHLIRIVDLATGGVATLTIDGLTPPPAAPAAGQPAAAKPSG